MGCRDEYATAAPLTKGHRRDGGQGRGDLLSPKRKSAGLVPEKLAAQNVSSAARVAAAAKFSKIYSSTVRFNGFFPR